MERMIRARELCRLRARSKDRHYCDIRAGLFTKPVAIGGRAVAWPESECQTIQNATVAGATTAELRELVTRLHAERTARVRG